jgi:catechol 2,3-dioxygenase-like lactoylglutathione lyase family enzyme
MITALRHAAMGVHDAEQTYRFYRDFLGFRVLLSDRTGYADEMKQIIGALVEMRVMVASNKAGGGAVKFIEHTSTRPLEPPQPVQWGDLGYLELGLEAYRLEALYLDLKSGGVEFLTPVRSMELSSGGIERYAYLRDPDGLLVQLVEVGGGKRPAVGGVRHVAIGVSDMQKARELYSDAFGFEEVIHDFKGRLPELDEVTGGKEMELAILGLPLGPRDAKPGPLRAIVKLVHTPGYMGKALYDGRRWGDIGLTEAAFDTTDFGETINILISRGVELLHPPVRADLEPGSGGSFAYVADPHGGLMKIVEAEKMIQESPRTVKQALAKLPVLRKRSNPTG